jgi:hypothetical protein
MSMSGRVGRALAEFGKNLPNAFSQFETPQEKRSRELKEQLALENQRRQNAALEATMRRDNATASAQEEANKIRREEVTRKTELDAPKLEDYSADKALEDKVRESLNEFAGLRGGSRGEGRYKSIGPLSLDEAGTNPSAGGVAQTYGAGALPSDLARLGANRPAIPEDVRKVGLSSMTPASALASQEWATSKLPSAKEGQEGFMRLQTEEDKAAAADAAERKAEDDRAAREAAAAAGKTDKSDDKEITRFLQEKDKVTGYLNSTRSNIGKQNDLIDRVDRDLSLIDGALSGKQPMTKQKWVELNAGLMNVIGGSISEGSLESLTSTTAAQDALNKLQYLSNSPKNAVDPTFIKDVRESFKRIRDITEAKRENRINAMTAGYEKVLTPEHIETIKGIARSYTTSPGTGGSGMSDKEKVDAIWGK